MRSVAGDVGQSQGMCVYKLLPPEEILEDFHLWPAEGPQGVPYEKCGRGCGPNPRNMQVVLGRPWQSSRISTPGMLRVPRGYPRKSLPERFLHIEPQGLAIIPPSPQKTTTQTINIFYSSLSPSAGVKLYHLTTRLRFRVQGSQCFSSSVQGLGFLGFIGFGFRVQGFQGLWVSTQGLAVLGFIGFRFRVQGFQGLSISTQGLGFLGFIGFRFRVQGFQGLSVLGLGFRVFRV